MIAFRVVSYADARRALDAAYVTVRLRPSPDSSPLFVY
jgi:hypothetical protein